MATLKVQIKDSRFATYSGGEVKQFTPTYINGNGWECYINEKGDITCIAQQVHGEVKHILKFTIKNFWVKLKLKIGEDKYRMLKSYKLANNSTDGIIGLPSGYIDRRRVFFRCAQFQEFLDSHELTSVNFDPPNTIYVLYEEFCRGESIYKEEIECTDGTMELLFKDLKRNVKEQEQEEGSFIIIRQVEVANARWAIKRVVKGDRVQRILYTRYNPKTLDNLPKK